MFVLCSGQDSKAEELTYEPAGGLGLWPGPIIDAHFQEKGRQVGAMAPPWPQGRLVELLGATAHLERGATWAIGLDEDTGVECRPAEHSCVVLGGPGGAWVARLEEQEEGRLEASTHYLTRCHTSRCTMSRGDMINTTDLSVTFPDWKSPVDRAVGPSPLPPPSRDPQNEKFLLSLFFF